ncbi:MAG: hypothetical protein MUE67_13550 [Anaerolineales bacterium]|nr:hypothetical protein [Anaerolineales bacterium]
MRRLVAAFMRRFASEHWFWNLTRLGLVLVILAGLTYWSARLLTPPEFFPAVFFSPLGLRFWLMPVASLLIALWIASSFIRQLYALPSNRLAVRYVLMTLFGLGQPVLRVERGRLVTDPDQPTLLERVGGPGNLNILPGNLALLENENGPSSVHAHGYHHVQRGEIIRETISLTLTERRATTKDGIEVVVRDIRYLYRLRPSRRNGEITPRSPSDPFPYLLQSVRGYVYSRSVGPNGLTPIAQALSIIVDGAIVDYINAHRFDDLTTPPWGATPHPREAITDRLRTAELQTRLQDLGIELEWIDIGHLDVARQEVWDWRVRTWGANWIGGRADALTLLIARLNEARLQGASPENIRRLVLLYTAQILDEMGQHPNLHAGQPGVLPPPEQGG